MVIFDGIIMKKITLFFIFLYIFILPVFGANNPFISDVRTGIDKDKIRIVLDFKGAVCDYYTYSNISKRPSFSVELYNCKIAKQFNLMPAKKDRLFSGLTLKNLNSRRSRLTVNLLYELPDSNIKTSVLKNPEGDRLVIDFYRNYSVSASYKLSDNMLYSLTERGSASGYTRFCMVSVDKQSENPPSLDILCADGREKTTSMRKESGAVMAVNGGFFAWSGGNLGLIYKDEQIISPHVDRRPPRTALALLKDGKFIVERMAAKSGEIVLLNGGILNNVNLAIGGGPRLIRNSQIAVNAQEEGLGKGGNDITHLAGRTAAGIDDKGNLALFTASGYFESHGEGIKLEDMAQFMLSKGMKEGINFDGGGSVMMDILGNEVSRTPYNVSAERPVGNAICVFETGPVYMPYEIVSVDSDKRYFYADGKDGVNINVSLKDAQGGNLPDGTLVKIIPSSGSAPYYVETKDSIASFSAGAMRVTCYPLAVSIDCAGLRKEVWRGSSLPGEPTVFYAEFIKPEDEEDTSKIEIIAEDSFGNYVPNASLIVTVKDGDTQLLNETILTNESGTYVFKLPFENYSNLNISVSYGGETFECKNNESSVMPTTDI